MTANLDNSRSFNFLVSLQVAQMVYAAGSSGASGAAGGYGGSAAGGGTQGSFGPAAGLTDIEVFPYQDRLGLCCNSYLLLVFSMKKLL
jgi:hypothetical protein